MIERLAYLAFAVLALAIGGTLLTGSAASNIVPTSSSGVHTDVPVPDDFKPPECAGIAIANLVTGTGTFAGTAGNDLILGSAAADTVTSNAGDDCVLTGAGVDDLAAGTGGGSGGSRDVLNAGADSDRCRGEGGTVTYIGCEQVGASLLGAWVEGTMRAAAAGPRRALVFVGTSENNPPRTLTGVTYGGQAMTRVASAASGGGIAVTTEIWVLDETGIAAAAGATFVPTWSGDVASALYASALFSDVNQASLAGATTTNVGNGGSPLSAGAVASSWGDIVVYGVGTGNAISFTPDNGFAEGTDAMSDTAALQTAWKPSTGADETPSSTPSANPGRWAIVGAVIKSMTTP